MDKKKIKAQPPEGHDKLLYGQKTEVAAGIKAIKSSLEHVFGEVGVVEGSKALLKLNQFDGFDCPGCAWPDPDKHRSIAEFCENGAKAVAEEATKARVDGEFFAKYSVQELSEWSDYEIGKSGRITDPMILREGSAHYEPIAWDEAFKTIGGHLNALNSPDEAIFYTSGRTSNEAAFLYQLFVRQFGTNNLPDCSNMCHESSGTGLTETVGIGKGSVKLDDFYKAEVIMIMGQNPGTNHPRMLTALEKAKSKGAKIVSVNPLPEVGLMTFKHPQNVKDMLGKGTKLTDHFLQVRINGDVALLKALMIMLFQMEEQNPGKVLDHQFIEEKTAGYEDFKNDLLNHDLDNLISQTGIEAPAIREVAELLAAKNQIIICWAMGLTQHKNSVDNIREIVNLLLLKGSIGKPGAGTCPVRGHSNVQGDRTVGIWEKLQPEFAKKLQDTFHFAPPEKDGYDVVKAIKAMHEGEAKVFFAMGGNFLSATPDTEYTAKGLMNCDLTVQVSTKLNRSHLVHGKTAIILPCLGRTERDIQSSGQQLVSVENSTGVVHSSRGNKRPASDNLYSEPRIVAELAKHTLGDRSTVDWDDMVANYDNIRDGIEKTCSGFDDFNERVRLPGGFYLPNGAREAEFHTDTKKANFTINELADHQLKEGQYIMMTIRSHDQYNTTIYGLHDRYRGVHYDRRIVLMNEKDMSKAGLKPEQKVDLVSVYDGEERVARSFLAIPYDIPTQCVATYFPEANVLVPHNKYATKSNTPISKSVVIEVRS
ncbi:FdhF/YdeP family oxidoreductase [Fulvivirga sediminis]|uniref:FdhF/YdeP family oxidoreductase n=1 Tax=Fulvivirga sediminis TaxID=2803949 RepID=A0A937F876_9BACT|nr:FdhF/YdeP family oxidoreductase [Fulvivirga sediminis]MBL3658116.1 FdhF/YdeP family oxidoreductase [Fulvivirga sediminis]